MALTLSRKILRETSPDGCGYRSGTVQALLAIEGLKPKAKSKLIPLPYIDKVPRNRRRGRHRGRDEMGAAFKTLAALEIAVRG